MTEPLLEVKHLSKHFPVGGFFKKNYLIAVEDVSFEMPGDKPTITTLAGESGSGKTTLSMLILGFTSPTHGEILFRGKSVVEMLKRERLTYRKAVQAVFQDPFASFNPFYKVDYMLMSPIKKFKLASSGHETRKLIEETLEAVGLTRERALGKYVHQLSGGEAQRVMIARALLPRPQLLVADEPVSMVDMSLRAGILNVLLDLKKKYDMSILFVTHDLSVAYYLSDNIIMLNRGRIVEKGGIEEVIKTSAHPYVKVLMDSIPVPNPKLKWKEKIDLSGLKEHMGERHGCIFLERCPHAEDRCKNQPQLIKVSENHWVACHTKAPNLEEWTLGTIK